MSGRLSIKSSVRRRALVAPKLPVGSAFVALIGCALSLSGCYSFRGPEPVLGATGVQKRAAYGTRSGPLFNRFAAAAYRAAGCNSVDVAAQAGSCTTEASTADQRRYMQTGYALIYADCDDFFAHMGRRQGASRILRASIAPVINLLTGLITLRNFSNGENEKDILTVLTLGSNAATSGLDIFDENFLFGANNIDAVRQLITRALAQHASETFGKPDLSFEQATINILDNQDICRPPQIMKLTREAIANGAVIPRVSTEKPAEEKPAEGEGRGQGHGADSAPTAPAEGQPGTLETTSVSVPR